METKEQNMQTALMQLFENMDTVYEEYAKSKGLNYLSLAVLEELYELGDGCTQKQISEDIHYPKQSINLVIRSFLDKGYVTLKEMPENRKIKQITLTDAGRQLCNDTIVPLLKQEEQAIAEMGEDKSRQLFELLSLYSRLYCRKIHEINSPKTDHSDTF